MSYPRYREVDKHELDDTLKKVFEALKNPQDFHTYISYDVLKHPFTSCTILDKESFEELVVLTVNIEAIEDIVYGKYRCSHGWIVYGYAPAVAIGLPQAEKGWYHITPTYIKPLELDENIAQTILKLSRDLAQRFILEMLYSEGLI